MVNEIESISAPCLFRVVDGKVPKHRDKKVFTRQVLLVRLRVLYTMAYVMLR